MQLYDYITVLGPRRRRLIIFGQLQCPSMSNQPVLSVLVEGFTGPECLQSLAGSTGPECRRSWQDLQFRLR